MKSKCYCNISKKSMKSIQNNFPFQKNIWAKSSNKRISTYSENRFVSCSNKKNYKLWTKMVKKMECRLKEVSNKLKMRSILMRMINKIVNKSTWYYNKQIKLISKVKLTNHRKSKKSINNRFKSQIHKRICRVVKRRRHLLVRRNLMQLA